MLMFLLLIGQKLAISRYNVSGLDRSGFDTHYIPTNIKNQSKNLVAEDAHVQITN